MNSGARATLAVVAAVAALALVVLAAATGTAWDLEERELWTLRPPEATEAPPPVPPEFEDGPLREFEPIDWSWLSAVVWVVLAVILAITVWWLIRWLRERLWLRRQPAAAADAGEVIEDVEEPDLPVLQRGVEHAQRQLATTMAPSDAVIAAWLALEAAAEASGVGREPAQTPTEFTVAVLDRTEADPVAVRDLLALYHRARFSADPIDADDVEAAAHCLDRLAAGWSAIRASAPERT